MYVNWLRKTKPTLLKTHRVMRRRNACTKLYRRRKPTFVANVVLCSRTSSNPTFIGVIMRWCLVFTAARTDWMLWTKPWSTFSIRLVSAPTCRCTPWRNDSAIWKSTAASRAWTMRSAWSHDVHSRRRRTSSRATPSLPTPFWRGLGEKSASTFTRARDICQELVEKSAQTSSKGSVRSTEETLRYQFRALRRRWTSNDARSDFILPCRFGLEYEWLGKATPPVETRPFPLLCGRVQEQVNERLKNILFIITHHILYRIFYFSRKLSDQML